MHEPLATQQQHKHKHDAQSTVDIDGEVNRVAVEKEAEFSRGRPLHTGNHAGDDTGTRDTTSGDVDDNGAGGDTEPMDIENSNPQKDARVTADGIDGAMEANDHSTKNGAKDGSRGIGGSRQDEQKTKATTAARNDAMEVDKTDTGDNRNMTERGNGSAAKSGENKPIALAAGNNGDAAPKQDSKPKGDGSGNGSSQPAAGSAGGDGTGSGDRTKTDGAGAAAPAPAPPPPVLKGTLSYNLEQRRHVIRGMWNYENSNALPPQRFELIRNLNSDEDPTVLPKDGEFHGSFSLAYVHTTSKGKQKERSKVIPESGVKISFKKVEGKDKEYKVDGEGTNQFGIFFINGTAIASSHEGDPSYNIELRKRYKPSPAQPAGPVGSGSKKIKKSKKRKHSLVGTSSQFDDDGGHADADGPLAPPSQSHPSHVICLRGKLKRLESDDLGVTEIVHKITGMWATGLDLILADPENARGLCNRFEYEHKMSVANDVFPLSGRYTGWFDLTQQDGSRTRISERDVSLKFQKNNAGFYNVEGRGSNSFGKYRITGTLSAENIITIFRHFQPIKKKESSSKAGGSVTAAPPPLQGSGRPGKQQSAQTPAHPLLKLEDVVVPGDDKRDELPKQIPPPAHGAYSAVSRGVLRLNDDGAHTCSGKWAMTREHYNNGTTSSFHFRLEPHFAAEAAKAIKKGSSAEKDEDADKATSEGGVSLSSAPSGAMTFPVDSELYKGSFQMRRGATKYTTIIDQQVVLKFRKNEAGSYNVHGKGVNNIGVFSLAGTLILSGKNSGHIDLYRTYPVAPAAAAGPGGSAASKGLPTAAAGAAAKTSVLPKRPSTKDGSALPTADAAAKPIDGGVPAVGGVVPGTSTMLPGPPRVGSLQRRESSRLVKLPSRLEDDDPEAQMARIMDKCVYILKFMHEKDIASGAFFSEPVDPVAHGIPTYHEIISEPMDLGTIKKKMDANEIKTPEEFARLVRLVFENAMTFNVEPTHVVHQAGRNLLILFNQKFRDVERMVDNIRRSLKPSEAELREAERERKKREKEEAKKAKKRAKEDRKRKLSGEHGTAPKKTRLEQAQAMAAANTGAMAAIRAAAPANAVSGGSVTRAEFNLLLQMLEQLQGQMVQMHTLLANESGAGDADAVASTDLAAGEPAFSALPDLPPPTAPPEKKKPTKKKAEAKVTGAAPHIPAVEDLTPLTLKEQEVLTETINELPGDRLQGVIDIIRESATLNGDEEEIDLEIDQLDTATQRKLQKYVLKNVKQPRKTKPKAPKKPKAAPAAPKPKKSESKQPTPTASKPKSTTEQKESSFFGLFGGSKGDSESDSDSDSDSAGATNEADKKKAASAPKDDFNLGDGFDHDDDDDDDIGNSGMAANWNMSKPAAQSASTDGGDDASDTEKDLWGAAREKAAASKAREAERKALEDKIKAEAEVAKARSLAEAEARVEEIRKQREEEAEKEARQREQEEKEAEEAKQAAREAARAQVQAVEQTVDLDATRDIMKEYEQSLLEKELGGASPSSDFGF